MIKMNSKISAYAFMAVALMALIPVVTSVQVFADEVEVNQENDVEIECEQNDKDFENVRNVDKNQNCQGIFSNEFKVYE